MSKKKYSKVDRFIWRQAKVRKCLLIKGGHCKICNKDLLVEPWDATFHHRDGKEDKKSEISQLIERGIGEIQVELEKCDLLCNACHRKTHFSVDVFNEYYKEICKRADQQDGKRYRHLDRKQIVNLARLGVSASKIAEETNSDERNIRRILRETTDATGEKLIKTKEEYQNLRRKATDEQIIEAVKSGMYRDEMQEKLGLCNGVLSRRIKRLKKFGLLPNERAHGYKKRKRIL